MSLRIRIEHGQDAGKTWRLTKPGAYVIGRVPDTASMRVLDMKVSKAHATVEISDDGKKVVLRDLESRHGTTLNGQPLKGAKPLKPGDEIRLGLSILRALSDGEADVEAEPRSAIGAGEKVADAAAGTQVKQRKTLPPDALVGKEIGGYKVLQKIGQGGMGSVYTAEQLSLNRDVALKVLSEKFTSDRAFVDQFVNEARSAAALNHPNVVQVYDVGKQEGRYYFSMEFVSGGSLEEKLAEEGPQPWQSALGWMIDSANALSFATKRDILHRDVKPDNLMLAEDGSAKLCDLGLAKKAANADMLAAGIIGTPAFISPEAIRRKKDIDVRSDLYSLGCAFYRVLTGENPYPAKTVKDILLGHLKAPVPRVSQRVPDLPKDLDDVVFQLMQKDPGDRYESAEALWKALDKIRVQHGLEAHGIRPGGKKPLMVAIAAAVILVGALIFVLTRPKPEGQTGMTEADREKLEEGERQRIEAERGQFHSDAERDLLALRTKRLEKRLGMSNYRDAHWATLAGKFDTLAEDLAANETYGQDEEVLETARKARKAASELRAGVKLRTELASLIGEEEKKAFDAYLKTVTGKRQEFNQAVEAGDWVKGWNAVPLEVLEKLVEPFFTKKIQDILPADVPKDARESFGDDPLLDPEKLKPALAKQLPGDPLGDVLRKRVLQTSKSAHAEALKGIREATARKTLAGHIEAQRRIGAWIEDLPSAEGVTGPLAKSLAGWRKEATTLLEQAEGEERKLRKAQLDKDRVAYFELLKALRKPRGLLPVFRTEPARRRAETDAKTMKDPRYQALAQGLAGDATALGALFERIQKGYPGEWSSDRVEVLDSRGRKKSEKIKAVDSEAITIGRERRTWASLGPKWVLAFLFPSDGERLKIEGEQHRGIAVLAELALDYDTAGKHYQAYLSGGEVPDHAAIRRRLGQHADEKAAAEAWLSAVRTLEELDAFLATHDPRKIGEEKFWASDDLRQEVLDKKAEYMRRLTEARQAEAALRDGRYRNTVWGSVIRKTIDPKACYAGENPVEFPDIDDEEPKEAPEKAPEKPAAPLKDDEKPAEKPVAPPKDDSKPDDEPAAPPKDDAKPDDKPAAPPKGDEKPPEAPNAG